MCRFNNAMDNPVRLHWLDPRDPHQPFPPARQAMRNPNGLLAIGGDLSADRLIRAYAQGIFPWFNPNEPILWWCPDPRAVLPPAQFHLSKSLHKRLRQGDFAVSLDRAFDAVLEGCGGVRINSHGTWLGREMKRAYRALFEQGLCHSVEVWRHGQLIGGLYGVALGRAFFGESMFSRETDASKIALCLLARQLQTWAYDLIDCQIASAHLRRLGAIELPRERFLLQLRDALRASPRSGHWQFDIPLPGTRAHLPTP